MVDWCNGNKTGNRKMLPNERRLSNKTVTEYLQLNANLTIYYLCWKWLTHTHTYTHTAHIHTYIQIHLFTHTKGGCVSGACNLWACFLASRILPQPNCEVRWGEVESRVDPRGAAKWNLFKYINFHIFSL